MPELLKVNQDPVNQEAKRHLESPDAILGPAEQDKLYLLQLLQEALESYREPAQFPGLQDRLEEQVMLLWRRPPAMAMQALVPSREARDTLRAELKAAANLQEAGAVAVNHLDGRMAEWYENHPPIRQQHQNV